jgi:hypothetical protein
VPAAVNQMAATTEEQTAVENQPKHHHDRKLGRSNVGTGAPIGSSE